MTDQTPPAAAPARVTVLPGNVTVAALMLLVLGALAALGTVLMMLCALLAGARHITMSGDYGKMGDQYGPWMAGGGHAAGISLLFLALLALLGGAVAGGHAAAGWAILQRRSWGTVLGIVVSATALVVLIVGLASTLVWAAAMPSGGDLPGRMRDYYVSYDSMMGATLALGTIISLALIAAYVFVLLVLARRAPSLD